MVVDRLIDVSLQLRRTRVYEDRADWGTGLYGDVFTLEFCYRGGGPRQLLLSKALCSDRADISAQRFVVG